jgi:hypothetical protein
MFDEEASFDLPHFSPVEDRDYIYVVHFRSLRQNRRGVFYGTDEDAALRFCIHYSTVEKFSRDLWWNLLAYRELANDLYRRETVFLCGVTQDGLPVEAPPSFEPGEEPSEALLRKVWDQRVESRLQGRREDD